MADFSLEIDLAKFLSAIDTASETVATAAKRGMHDALDEWKAEAVDVAPIDKGTLRRGITVEGVEQNGSELVGEITANATEQRGGGRFNYAYYIHERDAGGKSLRTPGTVKQFLDEPAKKYGDKWLADIEAEISAELKRKGW